MPLPYSASQFNGNAHGANRTMLLHCTDFPSYALAELSGQNNATALLFIASRCPCPAHPSLLCRCDAHMEPPCHCFAGRGRALPWPSETLPRYAIAEQRSDSPCQSVAFRHKALPSHSNQYININDLLCRSLASLHPALPSHSTHSQTMPLLIRASTYYTKQCHYTT